MCNSGAIKDLNNLSGGLVITRKKHRMNQINPSRRTLVRGAAWSVPVVAIAVQAPAFAASTTVIVSGPETSKCPGKSSGNENTYIFTFTTEGGVAANASASNLIINDDTLPVDRVVIEGALLHVVSTTSSNSADAAGSGSLTYMVEGNERTYTFAYAGTHPNQTLCRRLVP